MLADCKKAVTFNSRPLKKMSPEKGLVGAKPLSGRFLRTLCRGVGFAKFGPLFSYGMEFRSNQFQIKATKIENTVKAEQKAKLPYIIEDSTLTRDMPGCLREDLELHFQPASGCFTVVVIKGLASVCPTDTIAARGATRHCNDIRHSCLLFPCGSSIR